MYLSGSARGFGYTVTLRGFLNRVYSIFQLKYRYTTNFGYTLYNALISFGYIGKILGCFGVFWRIFFGYTGMPLSILANPALFDLFVIGHVKCLRAEVTFTQACRWSAVCSLHFTPVCSLRITLTGQRFVFRGGEERIKPMITG